MLSPKWSCSTFLLLEQVTMQGLYKYIFGAKARFSYRVKIAGSMWPNALWNEDNQKSIFFICSYKHIIITWLRINLHIEVVLHNVTDGSSDLRRKPRHHAVVPLPELYVNYKYRRNTSTTTITNMNTCFQLFFPKSLFWMGLGAT